MRIAGLYQLLSRRLAWSNGAGRWLFVLPLLVAALAVANVQPVRAEMADYVGMDLDTNEVKLNDGNNFTKDTTITVNHAKRKFDLSMFAETAELKSDDNKSIKPIGGGNRDLEAGQWGYRLGDGDTFSPVSADQAKPTILKQNADDPQQMEENVKVTFAVNKSGVPKGTYKTKVTYTLTLAPSSWQFDSDTCRSGDQKSGCKVDIDSHMIPVKYTGNETKPEWQTVAKAEDAAHQGDWYDYSQRRWANAITVKPEALAKYQGKSVKVDDADVLGYWVYVPRYSYKVRDYSDVDEDSHGADNNFEIKFERANQPRRISDPSDTVDHDTYEPDIASWDWHSPWKTPRGFVFGDRDLNGIWLSKYQISFANNTAQSLPNQPMLRGGTKDTDLLVKSLAVLQSIGKPDPKQPEPADGVALPPVKPNAHNLAELSSRMPRSSEYATAIYLAYSKYGIGLNREHKYTEGKNRGKVKWYSGIQGNNFDLYTYKGGKLTYGSITGCGPLADQSTAKYGKEGSAVRGGEAGTNAACGVDLKHGYYTKLGQLASTSGNQTGIYDMAGSNSWEVTASLMKNVNGDEGSANSNSGIEDEGEKLSFKEVLEGQFESGKLPAPYYEYLRYDASGDDEQNEFTLNSGKDFGDDADYGGEMNGWINYGGMANDEFYWRGGDYLDGSTGFIDNDDVLSRNPLVSRGGSDGDDAENKGVSNGPLSMYISSIFKPDGSDTYRAVLTLPPKIPKNDDSDN